MDKLTRQKLKSDKFAEEVTHSISYLAGHRRQTTLYGAIAIAVVVIGAGTYFYRKHTHDMRQQDLAAALAVVNTPVGQPVPGTTTVYSSDADKTAAERKALEDVVARFSGSDEAAVAEFQLGVAAANNGDLDGAAKRLESVVSYAGDEYESNAKFALAQVYEAQGKTADAEKLLRELMASPTMLVSKEQATFELAKVLAKSKPEEARSLLEPLEKDTRPAISRNAVVLLSQLPPKPVK